MSLPSKEEEEEEKVGSKLPPLKPKEHRNLTKQHFLYKVASSSRVRVDEIILEEEKMMGKGILLC